LYNLYNDIKNFIKRIPNDGIRSRHLKNEIELFYRRVKGLDDCVLRYRHSEKNQRISDCFTDYVSDLKDPDKSYKTISVRDFWEMIYDPQKFLDAQEISLMAGGKIERIYLVDSTRLVENMNSKEEQLALLRNYEQHMQYPNYCFSVLFSTAESEVKRRENFAIWSDKKLNYKVLFSIKYGLNTYAVTDMTFANYLSKKSENMKVNRGKVDAFENIFNFSKKRVLDQNNKLLKYFKNQKHPDENSSNEDRTHQAQLDFLRLIGIKDIEKFLSEKKIE
jgi:hypothetical protein